MPSAREPSEVPGEPTFDEADTATRVHAAVPTEDASSAGEGADSEGADAEAADHEVTDPEGAGRQAVDDEGTDAEDVDDEGVDAEGVDAEGVDDEGVDDEAADGEAVLSGAADERGGIPPGAGEPDAGEGTGASAVGAAPVEGADDDKRPTLRDWWRPDRSQLVIGVVLAVFAFAAVAQVQVRDDADSFRSLRQSELVEMLDTLDQESDRLDAELRDLQATRDQLESGRDSEELARTQAQARLTALEILAGTAPAYGPGVRITIQDPQGNVSPSVLLDAIEEMRDAGAEAIEVNDEVRVVASSWVGKDGDDVVVDATRVRPPYQLEVIGDPHALDEAAMFRGGLASQVQDPRVGGTVLVEQSDSIAIESLHEPIEPRFAERVETTEGD